MGKQKTSGAASGTQPQQQQPQLPQPQEPLPPPTPKVPRARTSLEQALASATATKSAWSHADVNAGNLIDSLRSDPEYKKEKASYLADIVLVRSKTADLKKSDPFFSEFLVKEIADVRKSYPNPETMAAKCIEFKKKYEQPTMALGKLTKEILAVVRVRRQLEQQGNGAAKKRKQN